MKEIKITKSTTLIIPWNLLSSIVKNVLKTVWITLQRDQFDQKQIFPQNIFFGLSCLSNEIKMDDIDINIIESNWIESSVIEEM